MNGIRNKILKILENNQMFNYTNKEPESYNRDEIKKQVKEELEYYINGHSYSNLLVDQICDLYGQGFVEINNKKHPYMALLQKVNLLIDK